jgi:hypothetical protein
MLANEAVMMAMNGGQVSEDSVLGPIIWAQFASIGQFAILSSGFFKVVCQSAIFWDAINLLLLVRTTWNFNQSRLLFHGFCCNDFSSNERDNFSYWSSGSSTLGT